MISFIREGGISATLPAAENKDLANVNSSSLILLSRLMATEPSPIKSGVLGITKTTLASSHPSKRRIQAADTPAAIEIMILSVKKGR